MKKATLLTLEITHDSKLIVILEPIFKSLGVDDQAKEVSKKYLDTFLKLSNELLEVLQSGAADSKAKEEEKVLKITKEEFDKTFNDWPSKETPKSLMLCTVSESSYIAVDNLDNEFIFEEFTDRDEALEYLLDWAEWNRKKLEKLKGVK